MDKLAYPLAEVYGLLEPGPVLLLTTRHAGRANVMTLSWHTMMEFEPPLLGCVLGPRDLSFEALLQTRQCVLNIPSRELAREVVGCGNHSGRDVDKFERYGLSRQPASQVDAPLIAQCHASLECRVVDTSLVERYGFFILEVVQAWARPDHASARTLHHRGHGAFMVAGETITQPSRMK
jgi:flavin reductase (DIM6/NTAB) family NADH-FMN oxidoreductase RutF